MAKYITIGLGTKISLTTYMNAVKTAKQNPHKTYPRGFNGFWPCTGAEAYKQFMDGLHERINDKSN